MLGFLAGGIVVHYFGYTAAFLLCGGMYVIGTLLVLFFVHENFKPPEKRLETVREKPKLHLPDFGTTVWLILGLFLLMAFARRFDESYLALQVEQIAGQADTEFHTGWISALAAGGGVIAGVSIGWLTDRFSPGKIAFPALALSIVFVLAQGFAPSLAVLGGARFFSFITAGGLEPVFLTMLSKASPPERRGQIFGWSSTFRTTGILLAALLGGTVIYHWGVRSVYITAALGFLLLIPFVGFTLWKIRRISAAGGKA